VSPNRGWAYGEGLYWTSDGGVTWHDELPGASAVVSVLHRSAWIVVARCVGTADCPETIYSTPGPGDPLTRLASQPPGSLSVATLLHPALSTAFALLAHPRGGLSFEATTDGGRHWTGRPLPCLAGADFSTMLSAAGPGALWLTCQRPSGLMDEHSGLAEIYRSADGGRSWALVTAPGTHLTDGLHDLSSLRAVSDSDAWAIESDQSGLGRLMRTTDGGRHWALVLDGTAKTPFSIDGLATRSDGTAWVSVHTYPQDGRQQLEVYRTADGGRTWQVSTLPVPKGLPG
jgi:photosystem II stability/assembly factor-like uncharacterized protein